MHDAILLAPNLILGGILFWVLVDRKAERKDRRIAEIDAARERADLLQRIQAPEAAITAHDLKTRIIPIPNNTQPIEDDPEALEEQLRQEKELERVGTVVGGDDE